MKIRIKRCNIQNDYIATCQAYRKLILDVLDFQFNKYDQKKFTKKKYKHDLFLPDGTKGFYLERNWDREFEEITSKLTALAGPFRGYVDAEGNMVESHMGALCWIESVKNRVPRTYIAIYNAIYEEMIRQEKAKGLVLEIPAPQPGGENELDRAIKIVASYLCILKLKTATVRPDELELAFMDKEEVKEYLKSEKAWKCRANQGYEEITPVFYYYSDCLPKNTSINDLDWRRILRSDLTRESLIKTVMNFLENLTKLKGKTITSQSRQEEEKATETPWELNKAEREVRYNNKASNLSEILFVIFEKLYVNEGIPVTIRELCKITGQERGYVRDSVIDLKNTFVKDLRISRDLMEKIIEKTPSTRKIQSFTFHKNP